MTDVKKIMKDILGIVIGSFLVAVAINVFIIPNELLSGSIGGLAIITNYFTGFPVGPLIALYNVPIMLWARKELTPRFVIYTIIAIIFQSIFLSYPKMTTYTNDVLLACIFGGVILGLGAGLVIKYHGSAGGSDIIAIILKKRIGISIGTVTFIATALIVTLAIFIFGLEKAMYTLLSLYICGKTLDGVQVGLNRKHTAMIVSDKSDEVKEAIITQLMRGVTLLHGAGGYKNIEKDVIFCVVNQFELARLKETVNKIDPSAFMSITETSEALGGFQQPSIKISQNTAASKDM